MEQNRILVVDDDREICEAIAIYLKSEGNSNRCNDNESDAQCNDIGFFLF